MPEFSRGLQRDVNSTSGVLPLVLLQVDHEALSEPIRVVCDNQAISSLGETYVAFAFDITLPDDYSGRLPKATLSLDNVGRELTRWLEASGGGRGATCTIRLVRRAAPNVIEYETTMELSNLHIGWIKVEGELGFEDLLNRPAVQLQYRQDTAPGLFV